MPEDKGKELEEKVSEGLDGKESEKPDEKTAEGEDGKKAEVDQLLTTKVKVPTAEGGEKEMSVDALIKGYGGMESKFTKGQQAQQILKDPERLKAYLKSEFDTDLPEETTENSGEDAPDDELKEAIEGGKRAGFVHKDDLAERDKLLIERTKMEIYLENLESPRILSENFPDIDSNDLPEFSKYEIVKYMSDEGFRDPVKAYSDKFSTELKALEKKAIASEKSTFTEKPTLGTVKLPPGKSPGKMTEDETRKVMTSMLEGK